MSPVEPSDPYGGLGTEWAFQALGLMMRVEGRFWLNSFTLPGLDTGFCDHGTLPNKCVISCGIKNSSFTRSSAEVEGNIKSISPAQTVQVQKGAWSCVFNSKILELRV